MKLNILFGFTAFVLIFSGISSVVGLASAADCPSYPNCSNNQTSANGTLTINGTSTTTLNQTSSTNSTVTYNGTSSTNSTVTYNGTSSTNSTVTYNGTSSLNPPGTNETSENYTNSSSNATETGAVQPLIIVPSNMSSEINNSSNSVVPYDIGTIHSSVAAEVNIENKTVSTTTIDDNVSINATNSTADSVKITVSAADQTGPKVIIINLSNTTINVGNLEYLGIKYDGKPIAPAANVDAILHAKSTDDPNFAIIVTQTGAQILVLIPHFSTHTITLSNLDKITASPAPEFPWAMLILVLAIIPIIALSRKTSFGFTKYQK